MGGILSVCAEEETPINEPVKSEGCCVPKEKK